MRLCAITHTGHNSSRQLSALWGSRWQAPPILGLFVKWLWLPLISTEHEGIIHFKAFLKYMQGSIVYIFLCKTKSGVIELMNPGQEITVVMWKLHYQYGSFLGHYWLDKLVWWMRFNNSESTMFWGRQQFAICSTSPFSRFVFCPSPPQKLLERWKQSSNNKKCRRGEYIRRPHSMAH